MTLNEEQMLCRELEIITDAVKSHLERKHQIILRLNELQMERNKKLIDEKDRRMK